jgi:hypothetical protein
MDAPNEYPNHIPVPLKGKEFVFKYDRVPEKKKMYAVLREEGDKVYLSWCFWNGEGWEEDPYVTYWIEGE